MEIVNKVAILISMGLTPVFLVLCVLVAFVFSRDWAKGNFKLETERDLLLAGIAIGFIGAFFDNLYWGVVWSCTFLDIGIGDQLNKFGSIANVPFRQVLGIVAACLHLKAIGLLKNISLPIIATGAVSMLILLIAKEIRLGDMVSGELVLCMFGASVYMLLVAGASRVALDSKRWDLRVVSVGLAMVFLVKVMERAHGDMPTFIDLFRDCSLIILFGLIHRLTKGLPN